jgi:hypothetical protein
MQSEHSSKVAPSDDGEDTTVANLLDNIENGVWHAFDYLALEGDATAPKTKLKVKKTLSNCFQEFF